MVLRPTPRFIRILGPVLAALALAGCGRGFDRTDAVEAFNRANPEATPAQSECVVDRLVDRYELAGLQEQLEADPVDARFEADQFRDMFACGMDGDVREELSGQLAANGVADADAPCVADRLVDELTDDDIDVLLSGEITDQFFQKFFSAMERCGAVNADGG